MTETATIRVALTTRDLLAREASRRGMSLAALLAELAQQREIEAMVESERAASRRDAENPGVAEEDLEWEATLVDGVVVVPLSSSRAPSSLRPEVAQPAGVDEPSRAMCRATRAVARSRLLQPVGTVSPETLTEIERALRLILGLNGGRTSAG